MEEMDGGGTGCWQRTPILAADPKIGPDACSLGDHITIGRVWQRHSGHEETLRLLGLRNAVAGRQRTRSQLPWCWCAHGRASCVMAFRHWMLR